MSPLIRCAGFVEQEGFRLTDRTRGVLLKALGQRSDASAAPLLLLRSVMEGSRGLGRIMLEVGA